MLSRRELGVLAHSPLLRYNTTACRKKAIVLPNLAAQKCMQPVPTTAYLLTFLSDQTAALEWVQVHHARSHSVKPVACWAYRLRTLVNTHSASPKLNSCLEPKLQTPTIQEPKQKRPLKRGFSVEGKVNALLWALNCTFPARCLKLKFFHSSSSTQLLKKEQDGTWSQRILRMQSWLFELFWRISSCRIQLHRRLIRCKLFHRCGKCQSLLDNRTLDALQISSVYWAWMAS